MERRDVEEAKNVENGHGNISPELILTCDQSLSTVPMMFFRQVYLTPLILYLATVSVFCNFADINVSFFYLAFKFFRLYKLVLHLFSKVVFYFFLDAAAYDLVLLLFCFY